MLGCCLLDTTKTVVALKAGANTGWFFDARHAEVFNVLSTLAINGGGSDALSATLLLREQGTAGITPTIAR